MERMKDRSLVEVLEPEKNENILDLGCGDGEKTKEIAASGARVVGIDNNNFSREWKKVKLEWKKVKSDSSGDLEFQNREATNLNFNEEFDAVFSYRVIHHIRPPEPVISSVWNALKPRGRFVAEFYGGGTAKEIILALQEVMSSPNDSFDINKNFPWYLPTEEEYCNLLTSQGFTEIVNEIFPKKLDLEYGVDIRSWLEQIPFNTEMFNHINKEAIFENVQKKVSDQLFRNDKWFVNYQHIRIVARKSSQLSNNN